MEQFLHNLRKLSNTERATSWGPTHQQVPAEPTSPGFFSFVSDLIEVENLIPDPSPDGGGLHQTRTAGLPEVHSHFTVHSYWSSWPRRVNLLLCLNEDCAPEGGGELELWSANRTRCVEKVTPASNSVRSAAEVLPFGDRYFQRRRGSA